MYVRERTAGNAYVSRYLSEDKKSAIATASAQNRGANARLRPKKRDFIRSEPLSKTRKDANTKLRRCFMRKARIALFGKPNRITDWI